MSARAVLLLLADGRFPSGGHAHSGGLEAATEAGLVTDLATLEAFLVGRLATAGLVAAALAATACRLAIETNRPPWLDLDAEADARTPSPAQRATGRRQGRQLLRAARQCWANPVLDDLARVHAEGPHHPIALGAATASAGLDRHDAALAAAHAAVTGPASAAVRLLRLDPMAVAAMLARIAPAIDQVVNEAAGGAFGPLRDLPAANSPLLDLGAEAHAARRVRLFAS